MRYVYSLRPRLYPPAAVKPVRLAKGNENPGVTQAQSYMRIDDVSGAISALENSLQEYSGDILTLKLLASYYHRLKDSAFSKCLLEQALAFDKNRTNMSVLVNLGMICRALGDTEKSEAYFKEAYAIDGFNPVLLTEFSVFYASLGRCNEAHALIQQRLQLNPGDMPLTRAKAMIYWHENKLEASEAIWEGLCYRDSGNFRNMAGLQLTYMMQGKWIEAAKAMYDTIGMRRSDPLVKEMEVVQNLARTQPLVAQGQAREIALKL